MLTFPTNYDDILKQVKAVDPKRYAKTRNFHDGAVSRLSPYISRGVISTRQVMEEIVQRDLPWKSIEKYVQELAWRDYWQQVWKVKKDEINFDLKNTQEGVDNHEMPAAVLNAQTGIDVMDVAIEQLYDNGYMHNHMRMYVASVSCNFAKSHWKVPAQWMYYHLLDADWASNALSWQWVVGANSSKKYFANQANINKYFRSQQRATFLDKSYEELSEFQRPEVLHETTELNLQTELPETVEPSLNPEQPLMLYNFYNLDPNWDIGEESQRVLLLERDIFEQYPISKSTIDFLLALSENIPNIQIFTGSFEELRAVYGGSQIHFKEHPLNNHYRGKEHSRDWMFPVEGYCPSFFGFWKKCMNAFKARM